jgi:hypothetical protein
MIEALRHSFLARILRPGLTRSENEMGRQPLKQTSTPARFSCRGLLFVGKSRIPELQNIMPGAYLGKEI